MPAVELSERFFQCPYCWERVSVLIDETIVEQSYIEDCEVCCRPIEFKIGRDNDGHVILEAVRVD